MVYNKLEQVKQIEHVQFKKKRITRETNIGVKACAKIDKEFKLNTDV